MRLNKLTWLMFLVLAIVGMDVVCGPEAFLPGVPELAGSSSTPTDIKDAAALKATDTESLFGRAEDNAARMIDQGRQIFRFDTFGDQAFWGGALRMHQVVSAITPLQALSLGLKVDSDALSPSTIQAIKHGQVNLNDPAVTVSLVKQNAVLGVVGIFDNQSLTSVGFSCALCHSTVNDSIAPGIGQRIDGLANRDLDVGKIVAAAPNLQPVVDFLRLGVPSIDLPTVLAVLNSWGPGKYDAEIFLDGKSGATLLPNARGLAGHNLGTWTGGWGTVTYWNAFVANAEMHGSGTFFDPRLDNAAQYPVAAAAGLGHLTADPEHDQITSKLPALQVYQLALPAPKPRPGIDFDIDAAQRGDQLFVAKANCNSCHVKPLWTEPGLNQHTAAEMHIDDFQSSRSPGHAYRTANLAGLFVREQGLFMKPENKGRFYHDGRFQTLLDVVNSYNQRFGLSLTDQEKHDLVEYLKSL